MSAWLDWFGGSKRRKDAPKEAIVQLREQISLLEKRENHLRRQIDTQLDIAKANAHNKDKKGISFEICALFLFLNFMRNGVFIAIVALQALKRKKAYESDLQKTSDTKDAIETQVTAIETANINYETMLAMKKGSSAMKSIHGRLNVDKVDATMDEIHEQMALGDQIADVISRPLGGIAELDEEDLLQELKELEQEELDEKMLQVGKTPTALPKAPTTAERKKKVQEEDEEEAELRALQAEMAM
ncbi:Vacuolar-sorting protein snf7 [Neolecta irregularis DAH-3]|uniref:Vacuolar-sorting protein SNF7 n=1 Tax=Neolecta irregularis (strain DAH-3) TaxID=1198029 RepID=A0A1U7LLG5_NEOID|nr:Vacuolar-sorting protein snf7 [Neolecta irregularis DAH-3]|eukprot:OLL23500.1 Vacuolar-sorting protein snf7 [Neolecta irregularis DAH-3]